ncbi:MAG: hypothetical protein ACNA8K_09060 [Cyclonatronaceae bacterium]
MKHPDDHLILRFVRNPQSLDPFMATQLQYHLLSCAACRGVVDSYRDFITIFGEVKPVRQRFIERHLNRLFPEETMMVLRPIEQVLPDLKLSEPEGLVLAAMTPVAAPAFGSNLATYASSEHETLARIMQGEESGLFRLYVISSDPDRMSDVIFTIPALEIDIVTDERGKGVFRVDEALGAVNWGRYEPVLRNADHRYSIKRQPTGEWGMQPSGDAEPVPAKLPVVREVDGCLVIVLPDDVEEAGQVVITSARGIELRASSPAGKLKWERSPEIDEYRMLIFS